MSDVPALFDLSGRVALVTGAAGQLGRAFTASLRDMGATVVETDAAPRQGEWELDITDESSVQSCCERIRSEHGRLDILVNNAGIGVYTLLEDRTVDDLDRVSSVNLRGTVLMTRAAAELMPDGASIVNVASIYGLVSPDPRIYGDSGRNSSEIYGATKAGVVQLTKWFSVHYAPRRIRVNCVTPGGVFAGQDPEFVRGYEQRTPLGRMADAADLVGGVVYLASGAAAYVTGHNLVIDGGWSAW